MPRTENMNSGPLQASMSMYRSSAHGETCVLLILDRISYVANVIILQDTSFRFVYRQDQSVHFPIQDGSEFRLHTLPRSCIRQTRTVTASLQRQNEQQKIQMVMCIPFRHCGNRSRIDPYDWLYPRSHQEMWGIGYISTGI